jgi:hypothetical protein
MPEPLTLKGEQGTVSRVENIIVQRQTMESRAVNPSEQGTKAAVEAIAAQQALSYEQLKAFWDEHQALRRDTGTAFEV